MSAKYNSTGSLADYISIPGQPYEPKLREHDPTGLCKHGFPTNKPCYPCQRRGDATCCLCFDFGVIVLSEGGTAECFCKLGEE